MKTTMERIRELREDKDITQGEIAEILGIRQNVYSRYEVGKNEIKIENLKKLADIHGVSTDYLLGRTDEPKPYPPAKA